MEVKVLLVIIVSLLILPIISSQTYEQSKQLDLKIPFEVNGSIPSSSANCNVSVQAPNGTYIKNYVNATNQNNGEFNITLIVNDSIDETAAIGEYTWTASCCDGSQCARGYDIFEITPTGKETPESMPFFFGIIVLIIFGISWFFLILSLRIGETGPKIFFIISSLIFLIASIGVGVVFADDNNVTESVSGLMGSILFVLGIILIIVFFYIFIRQTVEAINLMRIKKGYSMPVGEYKVKGAY